MQLINFSTDARILLMMNPVCLSLILFCPSKTTTQHKRVILSLRASATIGAMLLLFMCAGGLLLKYLEISINVFSLFGAILLMLSCIKALLLDYASSSGMGLLVPFTFPIAAGPIILSRAMNLTAGYGGVFMQIVASIVNCGLIIFFIACSFIVFSFIVRIPGTKPVLPLIIKLSYVFYGCLSLQSIINFLH